MGDSTATSASTFADYHTCDRRLLTRLLYKHKNQHRKAAFYRKLVEVQRTSRRVRSQLRQHDHSGEDDEEEDDDDDDDDAGALDSGLTSLLSLRTPSSLRRLHSLVSCGLLPSQLSILKASRLLTGLLGQTYFMSFALTGLAILARVYATQRAMLLRTLAGIVAADDRRTPTPALAAPSAQSTPSLTYCAALQRALRDDRELEWLERCQGRNLADLVEAKDDQSTSTAGRRAVATPGVSEVTQVARVSTSMAARDEEGDSDEEEEATPLAVASTPTLPSHLAFFARTATASSTDSSSDQRAAGVQTPSKFPTARAVPSSSSSSSVSRPKAPSSQVGASTARADTVETGGTPDKTAGRAQAESMKAREEDEDEAMAEDEDEEAEDSPAKSQQPPPHQPQTKRNLAVGTTTTTKPPSHQHQPPANRPTGQKALNTSLAPPPPRPATAAASPSPSSTSVAGVKRKAEHDHHGRGAAGASAAAGRLSPAAAPPSSTSALTSLTSLGSTPPPPKKKKTARLVGDPFAPQAATAVVGGPAKQKKAKLKSKPAQLADEMDDIFG